jgi:hypothetical protein
MIGKNKGLNIKNSFKIQCLFTLALVTCSSVFASSTQPINDADVAEINEMAEPGLSSSEMIHEAIDAYLDKRGITEGVEKNGKVYSRAVERVSASRASPAWAKSRQIAFEKALLSAQAAYVFDNFGRNTSKTEQIVKSDDSTNAAEFDDSKVSKSKLASIFDKAVALGDSKLNELLVDAGVNPDEYAAVPEAERKDLYINSYITTAIQKAMGASSGLLPLKTFTGDDGNGNHSVGVVMVRSDKLQQLASDISRQREPFLTAKKGKPLSAYIDHSGELLSSQFGVRVVFDEQGKPIVLSYGQWGFGNTGKNDARLERDRTNAASKADTVAIDALTTFMNSRIAYTNESTSGEETINSIVKQGDEITESDITNVIDRMNKNIQLTASAKLSGTRVVKRWKYKHPYGHEIVGRVRMWSMDGVNQSKDIGSFKPSTRKPESATIVAAPQSVNKGVKSGLDFDDEEETF